MDNLKIIEKVFGMNVLHELAENIAQLISETKHNGGVSSKDIPQIVAQGLGEKSDAMFGGFNCYPSDMHGLSCHELAVFISLQSTLYAKGRQHLTCREALTKIVQHTQGTCSGQTRHVLFITDNWDAKAYAEWADNISVIQQRIKLDAYLLIDNKVSDLKIRR